MFEKITAYNLILRTWDRRWKSYTFIHKNLNFLMVPKSSSVKAGILNLELTALFRESGYFDEVEINLWVITWISKKTFNIRIRKESFFLISTMPLLNLLLFCTLLSDRDSKAGVLNFFKWRTPSKDAMIAIVLGK